MLDHHRCRNAVGYQKNNPLRRRRVQEALSHSAGQAKHKQDNKHKTQ